jgi:hypothetical protein
MNTVNFFRKNAVGNRQENLRELKIELSDRGFDEKQIALILQRRSKMLKSILRSDSPMSYEEAVGRSK